MVVNTVKLPPPPGRVNPARPHPSQLRASRRTAVVPSHMVTLLLLTWLQAAPAQPAPQPPRPRASTPAAAPSTTLTLTVTDSVGAVLEGVTVSLVGSIRSRRHDHGRGPPPITERAGRHLSRPLRPGRVPHLREGVGVARRPARADHDRDVERRTAAARAAAAARAGARQGARGQPAPTVHAEDDGAAGLHREELHHRTARLRRRISSAAAALASRLSGRCASPGPTGRIPLPTP